MAQFDIGDLVVLKSGSMRMTVEALDDDAVCVVWCHEGAIGRDRFSPALLNKWEVREDSRSEGGGRGKPHHGGGGKPWSGDERGAGRGKPYQGRDDRGRDDRGRDDRGGDDRPPRKTGWDGKPRDKKYFRKDG